MSRLVHGVINKMDNGRKKFSKKVVRRAVRRANKASCKEAKDAFGLWWKEWEGKLAVVGIV